MLSFTTINKVDDDNFICKYENFATKEEADARIIELHRISGYEDAFVVDNDATAVNGLMCFQEPRYFPVDKQNKTVSFDQIAFDIDKHNQNMGYLRVERGSRLEASDIPVLPDRWATMSDDTKAAWSSYRQQLRDLPATSDTITWANSDIPDLDDITWPTQPEN
jgi:hypothetical protein